MTSCKLSNISVACLSYQLPSKFTYGMTRVRISTLLKFFRTSSVGVRTARLRLKKKVSAMSSKPKKKNLCLRILTTLYKFGCICGFLVQIHYISNMYFRYPTSSRLVLAEIESVYTPAYTVCFPFIDIMSVRQEHVNLTTRTARMSTQDILKRTPDPKECVMRCSYRDDYGLELQEYDQDKCLDYFVVDKFIMSEFVCYRVQRREFKNVTLSRVVSSLHDSTEMYSFSMSPAFKSGNFLKVIIYSSNVPADHPDAFPFYSRVYGSVFRRLSDNETREAFTNSYTSRYTWYIMYLLPDPYDTRCSPVTSRHYCFQGCTVNKFVNIDRTPPTELLTKPSSLIHFSAEDYKDETIMNETIRINDECNKKCALTNCFYDYSITTTNGYLDKKSNFLTFRLSTPTAPTTAVSALVQLSFIEFLIYLTSCFGTWFGISVLMMNPLTCKFVENFVGRKLVTQAEKHAKASDGRMSRENSLTSLSNGEHMLRNSVYQDSYHSLWRHYPMIAKESPYSVALGQVTFKTHRPSLTRNKLEETRYNVNVLQRKQVCVKKEECM